MPRIDDLLELMQSTADFYIVNPTRNLRSVYIQVDNLCELAMKTWLSEDSKRRQVALLTDLVHANIATSTGHKSAVKRFFRSTPTSALPITELGITAGSSKETIFQNFVHQLNQPATQNPLWEWSPDETPGRPKTFETVTEEIAERYFAPPSSPAILDDLLERIRGRRNNRNRFFHDPEMTGLIVDDKGTLLAVLDIYALCRLLFGRDYTNRIQANSVWRAQIALLKMRHRAYEAGFITNFYQEVCAAKQKIKLLPTTIGFDYCFLYEDAQNYLKLIKARFEDEKIKAENEIGRINTLKVQNINHLKQKQQQSQSIDSLNSIIEDCFMI